jgi:5-formyltetrahydrofolate cyclo-ligase
VVAHEEHTHERQKAALRTSALAARRELSDIERRTASTAIVDRLLGLAELRPPRTVLLYAAMRDEVDLAGLVAPVHERGGRTLFPRVRGDALELVAAHDLLTLRLGYRGIREPAGPAVDPEVIEVALIPGVAFDPHGARLGLGGGHYDRLLARLPDTSLRIGVCFACQVVPRVPRADHDEAVDLVVTNRATYRPEARALG